METITMEERQNGAAGEVAVGLGQANLERRVEGLMADMRQARAERGDLKERLQAVEEAILRMEGGLLLLDGMIKEMKERE